MLAVRGKETASRASRATEKTMRWQPAHRRMLWHDRLSVLCPLFMFGSGEANPKLCLLNSPAQHQLLSLQRPPEPPLPSPQRRSCALQGRLQGQRGAEHAGCNRRGAVHSMLLAAAGSDESCAPQQGAAHTEALLQAGTIHAQSAATAKTEMRACLQLCTNEHSPSSQDLRNRRLCQSCRRCQRLAPEYTEGTR